jgi:hypothetical protein
MAEESDVYLSVCHRYLDLSRRIYEIENSKCSCYIEINHKKVNRNSKRIQIIFFKARLELRIIYWMIFRQNYHDMVVKQNEYCDIPWN